MSKPLEELNQLEQELVFNSVALDLAIEALAKISGKSATEWGAAIAETTAKMLHEIPVEDLGLSSYYPALHEMLCMKLSNASK